MKRKLLDPFSPIIWAVVIAFGCSSDPESAELDTGTNDNTDKSTDSDADSDTDSDTDSDGDGDADGDADNGGDTDCNDNFSFFVMSMEAIQELSGNEEGFGGNLGGLEGADQKCQVTAEKVGSCRKWHAFLSVTNDGSGNPINAIDRIGSGPWYDVNGLLLSENIDGLLNVRPEGSTEIVYTDGWDEWPFNQCLTTELGNCNHSYGDTHDTLTGSDREGKLYSTDSKYTCEDWTSSDVNVSLPIGHTWPRQLNGTDDESSHWIYAHSNCTGGGGGGRDRPGSPDTGDTTCNGCGININLTDSMEEGVGGDGGYGAWYCFAYD